MIPPSEDSTLVLAGSQEVVGVNVKLFCSQSLFYFALNSIRLKTGWGACSMACVGVRTFPKDFDLPLKKTKAFQPKGT